MIGWNTCPAVLKEELNQLMCSDAMAINIFKNWLTQPGLDRPPELNYYEDIQLLKLLIHLLQDDQVFCGQQAGNILRTFASLLGTLESIKEVKLFVNPTVKKFLEHDALNYYAGLEKLNW